MIYGEEKDYILRDVDVGHATKDAKEKFDKITRLLEDAIQ